jgi:thioredoxin reductase (NADPH)
MTLPVILVVDDDPQVLAAIRRDLRSRYRADYRVLAASSGESALDVIKEMKAEAIRWRC